MSWRIVMGKGKRQQNLTDEFKDLHPELARQIDEAIRFMLGVDEGDRIEQEEVEALPYD